MVLYRSVGILRNILPQESQIIVHAWKICGKIFPVRLIPSIWSRKAKFGAPPPPLCVVKLSVCVWGRKPAARGKKTQITQTICFDNVRFHTVTTRISQLHSVSPNSPNLDKDFHSVYYFSLVLTNFYFIFFLFNVTVRFLKSYF